MKKQVKKLSLNKLSLRSLKLENLRQVAGATQFNDANTNLHADMGG